tara:strand:- start:231 stop:494 length:264 start_codon:yes stop_codon:yes gene_type:complete
MTTQTYKVELTYDTIDSILVQTLQTQFEEVSVELENRMGKEGSYGIFHSDKRKDIAAIKAQLKAIEKVLKYNMLEEEFNQWKLGQLT